MDDYSMHSFYNNDRKPMKQTTLHDNNISKSSFDQVVFIRQLMCRETMSSPSGSRFNKRSDNKENQQKR
ncbi:hypothetical protein [Perigonia lusca single nucleopolyhedrovirus]|uniref:Uncharacterized protein n=1 Tax=Perigonia lusca single nucleopolyhedrovirus TaxID=1675865 RepID=A0A0M3WR36_9ABAC|nr:hypothetical protein [Perigonia lusca single nucleopolyhedrovirus]AKN80641.1 hypothetical protein [Perigonia lusca single nucleopolyhedrovirus]